MFQIFRKGLILIVVLLAAIQAETKVLKVAVIDSGYNSTKGIVLCNSGHYDFITNTQTIGKDNLGHGTVVSGIIASYALKNYCLVEYKVFGKNDSVKLNAVAKAINMATDQGVDVINLSIQGSFNSIVEYNALKRAANSGIKIFIAAGNEKKDLDKICDTYPACYIGINFVIVGSLDLNTAANYGSVVKQREHFCSNNMCGTSMSCAIAAGKYVNWNNK
jgi:subtilisin